MHFYNSKKFIKDHKLFAGAFIFWFLFVNLLTPLKAIALVGTDANGNQVEEGQNAPEENVPKAIPVTEEPLTSEGEGSSENNLGDLAQGAATTAITCSIGAILGRLISGLIGILINQLMSFLASTVIQKVTGAALDIAECILHPGTVCIKAPGTDNQLSFVNLKETGYADFGPSGFLRWALQGVSMDSIMFCIVNEIMTYITQATISWINSGFNGNPVFVQNPQAFVQRYANKEVANFTYQLSGAVDHAVDRTANTLAAGVEQGAYNLFGPIRDRVVMNTIGNYTAGQDFYMPPPTISPNQYGGLQNGQWQGFAAYGNYRAPQNNTYGASMYTNLYARQLADRTKYYQMQDITINQGYHDFGPCAPGTERPGGFGCAPQNFLPTTKGIQVKTETDNRNLMKYLRISMAQDFDSIITALVNQLVKIAVNKIYEGADKASSAIQENTSGGGR